MAISLNRCLHLRWVQTLKFYFCNYRTCVPHSVIYSCPVWGVCNIFGSYLYFVDALFYISLCLIFFQISLQVFVLVFFCFILVITLSLFYFLSLFLSHWLDSPASLFYSLFIRNPIFPFFCCRSVCSPIPIRILSARYIFSSSRFLLLICRPGCIIQSALNGFGCIQVRAD